jgi:hypothetical protein
MLLVGAILLAPAAAGDTSFPLVVTGVRALQLVVSVAAMDNETSKAFRFFIGRIIYSVQQKEAI